jgi:uncharacterized membrane protein
MKFSKLNLIIIIVLFIFLLLSTKSYANKYYLITQAEIEAQLFEDGRMEVQESRSYKFSGSFSYVYREIPATGKVRFSNFAVSENGKKYILSDSQKPGTYSIKEKGDKIKIIWYFKASHENRTFDFEYTAENAIERYEDIAVLYFKFISEEWDKTNHNVQITLRPPEPLARHQVYHWLHGPLWAESIFDFEGVISAWSKRVPAHKYFEIRALYPPEIFPEVPVLIGNVKERIKTEEAKWAHQANIERENILLKSEKKQKRIAYGKWLLNAISLICIFIWILLFSRYGKRPKVPQKFDILAEIPEKLSPALVGYLLSSRTISGEALVGTLMDLSVRGFLEISEIHEEKKPGKFKKHYLLKFNRQFFEENSSDLQEYEEELIGFIFEILAKGNDEIDLKKIKKQRSKFTKFFNKWKKTVQKVGKEKAWFDLQSIKGAYYSLALGFIISLAAVYSIFLYGVWAAIPGTTAFIILILSAIIPHYTYEGKLLAKQWLAFKRFLKKYHYRTVENSELLSKINDFFIYGIVLGVGTKVFKELGTYLPVDNYRHYVPWYVIHSSQKTAFSPESFGKAFSTMIATTTSAVSSASGAGGGASGGGGGGASSGGGGAG